MKRNLLWVAIWTTAMILAALPVSAEDCEDSCDAPKGDPKVIRQLKVEINAMNLMNGLHLSLKQVEAVLKGTREVAALRERYLPPKADKLSLPPEHARKVCAALEEIKQCYLEGRTPTPKLLARTRKTWDVAKALGRAKGEKNRKFDRQAYLRELKGVEDRVLSLLTPSQLEVIRDYTPCLVPPMNLRDPVRVGQVKSYGGEERFLTNIRKIPQERWAKLRKLIVSEILSHWEKKHGSLTAAEREQEISKALTLAEKVRNLSEVDFQISKSDLAKEVTFLDKKEVLKKELETIVKKRSDPPGKVANFLLDPRILPVLERRANLMRNWVKDPTINLKDIEGAETCKDGKCGTKVKGNK